MDPLSDQLAFTSFTVHETEQYKNLVAFYRKLGFKIIKIYQKDAGNNTNVNGISTDSRKECWLEFFPVSQVDKSSSIIPVQETFQFSHPELNTQVSNYNNGVLIKIRLVSHDVKKNLEMPGRIVLLTSSLNQIEELAKVENWELFSKTNDDNIKFFIKDPMDNLIGFTNKVYFLNEEITSPDDFFPSAKEIDNLKEKLKLASIDSKVVGKRRIAIMTSGGDAPGMCAAVRSVVRTGIYLGCEVFGCYEGYSGLVKGGDLLKKLNWQDVRGWLSLGGTLIGTARCAEFREREGRLLSAKNMILRGIDALIVCGGDGSLTGADLFRSEWPSLVAELVSTKQLTETEVAPYKHLTIVGMVGSIDNDMAMTDHTIGAFSSLERICEMVDYIDSTAESHSRAFVVEVMGRHCGWLGLMSGICCGADFIFIPERPASSKTWKSDLKEVCLRHRKKGRRKTTVIVAEGAIDDELNPITSDDVKDVLVEIGLDTRVTTLGHVQRGGTAVAYDRFLATLQGVEAVKAVLDSTISTPSPMIGTLNNKIVRTPLVEAVKMTKAVAKAIDSKRFDDAMGLRDSTFKESFKNFLSISTDDDNQSLLLPKDERLKIGIIHVGAPTAALNPATRAAVLYLLSKGHTPYGILNGFHGLIKTGEIKELSWIDVEGWHNAGGSALGTNRHLPSDDMGTLAYHLQDSRLDGLIVIGGFEAFQAVNELNEARSMYPILKMPIVCLPSTVSNNVPGTEYSLGSDTCLNTLVDYCDVVKLSASSSRRRVFVIEVQGGNCGYIASYTGLVTGALSVYLPEEKVSLSNIQEDLKLLDKSYMDDIGAERSGKVFIRNEKASAVYTTQLIADIIKEAAHGKYESRTAIPGHVQQGNAPTSMDRVKAVRFAIKACEFIERDGGFNSNNAVVCGIIGTDVSFTNVKTLWEQETDEKFRRGTSVHWGSLLEANAILSGRLMIREGRSLA